MTEPRGNAHDVAERGKAIISRLKARAHQHGKVLDTTELTWRRRVYRAARRIEDARAQRGDTTPFLADGGGR